MMENRMFCELMCRACLGTGRLYSIYDYKLSEIYNQLTGTKVHPYDGLPQHLCAMCSTLMMKNAELKNRCYTSLMILDNIKKRQNMITCNLVSEELKFAPKRYSVTATTTTQYPPTSFNDDIIVDQSDAPFEYNYTKPIKSEPEMYIDNFSMKVDENSTDSYSSQLYIDEVQINEEVNLLEDVDSPKIQEKSTENEDKNISAEKFAKTNVQAADLGNDDEVTNDKPKNHKSKNFYNELDQPVDYEQVIDEKTLRNNKFYKELAMQTDEPPVKVKKPRGRKPKNPVKDKDKEEEPKETAEKPTKVKRTPKINKYKGKFFETKENMSGFESMYEVEVIILTKEQQLSDVLERKTSNNYLNSPFRCQYCFRGFMDEDNLVKHHKAQHDPSRGSVACEFCQFRYRDKRGLNQHLKTHRLKFVCRQCKYVSRTTYNAKEHYKMHRGMMHECKECGKAYEKLSTFLTHMRLHHPAELTWCELCGEPFVGQFGLNGHKNKAHRDLKFPPDCKCECGAHFTNLDALHHHTEAGCCGENPCLHCGATFSSRVQLKDHLLDTHRQVKKKFYNCPKNKSRLVYHQRVHTGERPYQCLQCPKTFTMSKLLRSHSRVHTNERPFSCKLCPKSFKGPSALRAHEYIHSGGRKKIRTRSFMVRNVDKEDV